MKFTKLSLVAAVAVSSAFAGGDIAPVEPVVEAVVVEVAPATTIAGKLTAYGITDDAHGSYDLFDKEASQVGLGATLDVSHNVTDWMTLNFSAVGYLNTLDKPNWGYMEGSKKGAFFNVANATFKYEDNVFIAGRQLLGTPMLQGYDWLLAPGSFEAYTFANSSIDNVTLVAAYVTKHRANNSGEFGNNLDGDNYTVSASYDDKTINASAWYYNVDAANYKQYYVDAGYNFGNFEVDGQYVQTDYATTADAKAFGIQATTTFSDIAFTVAYNRLMDADTGYVGWNNLYTNQWNLTVADQWDGKDLDAFKVAAATDIMGVAAAVSYADYDKGNETDVVLGYDFTKTIDGGLVYSNTKANQAGAEAVNQVEIFANYKF